VRRQPRSGKAWGELGMALIANGFPKQALTCLANARRFDPQDPRWPYWQGATLLPTRPTEGMAHLREALRLADGREQRAAILFTLALPLIEEGLLDEADQRLSALREIDPDDPRLHFGLGLLAVARDDQDAAREHLGMLTENPFARKRACTLLVNLYAADRQRADSFRKRAAQAPTDAEWPNVFQQELSRYRVELSRPLATYRELEGQGRHDEALAFLRNAAAQSPDEGVCFTLGFELLRRKQLPEAEDAFRKAIHFNPRNSKAHLFLATVLLQRGDNGEGRARELYQQAAAAADAALALHSDLAQAHLVRGLALKHLGRKEESLKALREAVLLAPELAETHLALGEALAEAGQVDEGLVHLENAVRHAKPEDPRPQEALTKWRAKAKTRP